MKPTFVIIIVLLVVGGGIVFNNWTPSENGITASIVSDLVEHEELEETMSTATFTTNKGTITIELFTEKMPITTGNFIKLAKEGFYDGTRFHRIRPQFMIQGGDPQSKDVAKKHAWGRGGPGYNIEDEFVEGLSNVRGTISMANTGHPNSGGSQFFINVNDNTPLDFNNPQSPGKHPVFGKVTSGMDVVDAIVNSERNSQDQPLEDVVIEKVVIS